MWSRSGGECRRVANWEDGRAMGRTALLWIATDEARLILSRRRPR